MEVSWLEQSAADVSAENDWLSSWEASVLRGMCVPKRRADWRLGRWTAKHAVVSYLNIRSHPRTLANIEIRPAESGAPEAFIENGPANVSISLSHRAGIGACAVAPSGVMLGCDLEIIEPRSDAFVADYFTFEEQAMVSGAPEYDRSRLLALLWSAKESALKALRVGLRVDTRCVAVTLGDDSSLGAEDASRGATCLSPSASRCPMGDWRPFRVCHAGNQVFSGWWQCGGKLMRTVVSDPSANPPHVVHMPTYG
jgi:4'-phosphopantetheinyl transferase